MPAPPGRAALGDARHRGPDEALGELLGVRDGRGGQHEDRLTAVEPADPGEPAQHVRHVGAEHPPVGVQLVDHHVTQLLEELRPLGMVGEDPLVQHVGVGDDHVAARAHGLARVARRVPVEGEGAHAEPAGPTQLGQLGDLILGEGLGGEQVQSLRALGEGGVQGREVVAEGLARSGGCDDHRVVAGPHVVPRLALVTVEPTDATLPQGRCKAWLQLRRQVRVTPGCFGLHLLARDSGPVAALEPGDQGVHVACRERAFVLGVRRLFQQGVEHDGFPIRSPCPARV